MTDIVIDSDEERCINDILEKGISELKGSTLLKSSLHNRSDNTNSIINNPRELNFNYDNEHEEELVSGRGKYREYNNDMASDSNIVYLYKGSMKWKGIVYRGITIIMTLIRIIETRSRLKVQRCVRC